MTPVGASSGVELVMRFDNVGCESPSAERSQLSSGSGGEGERGAVSGYNTGGIKVEVHTTVHFQKQASVHDLAVEPNDTNRGGFEVHSSLWLKQFNTIKFKLGDVKEVPELCKRILLTLPDHISEQQREKIRETVMNDQKKMQVRLREMCVCSDGRMQEESGSSGCKGCKSAMVVACALTSMRRVAEWASQFYKPQETDYMEMGSKVNTVADVRFQPPNTLHEVSYARYRSHWEKYHPDWRKNKKSRPKTGAHLFSAKKCVVHDDGEGEELMEEEEEAQAKKEEMKEEEEEEEAQAKKVELDSKDEHARENSKNTCSKEEGGKRVIIDDEKTAFEKETRKGEENERQKEDSGNSSRKRKDRKGKTNSEEGKTANGSRHDDSGDDDNENEGSSNTDQAKQLLKKRKRTSGDTVPGKDEDRKGKQIHHLDDNNGGEWPTGLPKRVQEKRGEGEIFDDMDLFDVPDKAQCLGRNHATAVLQLKKDLKKDVLKELKTDLLRGSRVFVKLAESHENCSFAVQCSNLRLELGMQAEASCTICLRPNIDRWVDLAIKRNSDFGSTMRTRLEGCMNDDVLPALVMRYFDGVNVSNAADLLINAGVHGGMELLKVLLFRKFVGSSDTNTGNMMISKGVRPDSGGVSGGDGSVMLLSVDETAASFEQLQTYQHNGLFTTPSFNTELKKLARQALCQKPSEVAQFIQDLLAVKLHEVAPMICAGKRLEMVHAMKPFDMTTINLLKGADKTCLEELCERLLPIRVEKGACEKKQDKKSKCGSRDKTGEAPDRSGGNKHVSGQEAEGNDDEGSAEEVDSGDDVEFTDHCGKTNKDAGKRAGEERKGLLSSFLPSTKGKYGDEPEPKPGSIVEGSTISKWIMLSPESSDSSWSKLQANPSQTDIHIDSREFPLIIRHANGEDKSGKVRLKFLPTMMNRLAKTGGWGVKSLCTLLAGRKPENVTLPTCVGKESVVMLIVSQLQWNENQDSYKAIFVRKGTCSCPHF